MPAAFVTGASGFVGGALTRSLVDDGWNVRALARSQAAASKVEALGAEVVRGGLDDAEVIATGARGCEYAFHSAAIAAEWGPREEFEAANVTGTVHALDGCIKAGVRRFVHVGTEAALLHGEPLVNADETIELQPGSPVPYTATKAVAERRVRDATQPGFETVVIRPRFVWGPGDQTVLPSLVEAVESGRFAWIGGGGHLTSTTHIRNCVHGLRLGAEKGRPGRVYFVTDGEPVVFREFVSELLRTAGVEPPDRSVPAAVAGPLARIAETLWRTMPLLPGRPPLTRLAVWLSSLETTLDISRARTELGYEPKVTVEEGLAELRGEAENA